MQTRGKKIDFLKLVQGEKMADKEHDSSHSSDSDGEKHRQDQAAAVDNDKVEEVVSEHNQTVFHKDDYDEQILRLQQEQEDLVKKVESKKKLHVIQALKAENQRLKDQLLSGGLKAGAKSASKIKVKPKKSVGGGDVQADTDLNQVKKMEHVMHEVEAKFQAYGDDVSSSSDSDEGSRSPPKRGKSRQSRGLKSGQVAKVCHSVKKRLMWPHTRLQYSHASEDLKYNQLDFPLLVAGEIACVLSPEIEEEEKVGRLELLLATAYHAKAFEWDACRNFHMTCLLEVERGDRSWENKEGLWRVEANTLYRFPLRSEKRFQSSQGSSAPSYSGKTTSSSTGPKKWFCGPFQRGECNHKGAHDANIKGQRRTVEHFCASCFLKSRAIRSHPESSKDCPLHSG